MNKVKIKMRRAFEGAIEDAADNLHNARRDWFDEDFYDDGSGLRPVDYLINNLIAIVNDDDTTLRARLEALVSELDPPSKTGEIVVMTAERVERHLIARKIRETLEGEDETA